MPYDTITIPLGRDAALYYATCVAGAQPTFTAANVIDAASNVQVMIDKSDAKTSRRAYPGWEDAREGMKRLRITFELMNVVKDGAGTEVNAITVIRNTFLLGYNGGKTGIALYARSIRSGHAEVAADLAQGGIWGDFLITKFERPEDLEEAQTISCEAVCTLVHGNNPTWITDQPA